MVCPLAEVKQVLAIPLLGVNQVLVIPLAEVNHVVAFPVAGGSEDVLQRQAVFHDRVSTLLH